MRISNETGLKIAIGAIILFFVSFGGMLIDIGFFETAFGGSGTGGNHVVINQQKSGITTSDSTDWYDVEQYGYPTLIVWQLSIINHNCQAAAESLYVWIESSNATGTDRNKYNWTTAYFQPSASYLEPATAGNYGFDSNDVGKAYRLTIPRDGFFLGDSSDYTVRPVDRLGKYFRLKFSTTDSRTWTVEYPFVVYED